MGDRLKASLVLLTLERRGLLITHKNSGKFSKPVAIKGLDRKRYYCISERFLEEANS